MKIQNNGPVERNLHYLLQEDWLQNEQFWPFLQYHVHIPPLSPGEPVRVSQMSDLHQLLLLYGPFASAAQAVYPWNHFSPQVEVGTRSYQFPCKLFGTVSAVYAKSSNHSERL